MRISADNIYPFLLLNKFTLEIFTWFQLAFGGQQTYRLRPNRTQDKTPQAYHIDTILLWVYIMDINIMEQARHGSSTSIYSADEQIIQLRSRPKESALNDFEQLLFTNLKQHCPPSQPDSPQSKQSQSSLSIDSPGSSIGSEKRRSLLRTPIKKRLKRHVNVLSQLRQSHKRRFR